MTVTAICACWSVTAGLPAFIWSMKADWPTSDQKNAVETDDRQDHRDRRRSRTSVGNDTTDSNVDFGDVITPNKSLHQ